MPEPAIYWSAPVDCDIEIKRPPDAANLSNYFPLFQISPSQPSRMCYEYRMIYDLRQARFANPVCRSFIYQILDNKQINKMIVVQACAI